MIAGTRQPSSRCYGCTSCGWAGFDPVAGELPRCPRCGNRLENPVAGRLQRTWALLFAATVLLLPANLMPIMTTVRALRSTEHTLIGGIVELWTGGTWGLALLVFVASIVVPLIKIGALAVLAWSVSYAPEWRRLERSRLYRLIEAVGHWSMLDVYVVLVLVGMVRFGNLAGASAGPALLAFAAVVVLTMLATHEFDPRWIWQDLPPRGRVSATGGPEPAA